MNQLERYISSKVKIMEIVFNDIELFIIHAHILLYEIATLLFTALEFSIIAFKLLKKIDRMLKLKCLFY